MQTYFNLLIGNVFRVTDDYLFICLIIALHGYFVITSQVNIEKSNQTATSSYSAQIKKKKKLAKFHRALLKVLIFTFGKGVLCVFFNIILLEKKQMAEGQLNLGLKYLQETVHHLLWLLSTWLLSRCWFVWEIFT